MKNKKIRSLIIAVVLLVTLYFIAPLLVPNLPSFWTSKRLKLGLDLQGGMQVLLEVDCSKLNISEKKKEEVVKTALEIIRNRIDQFGVEGCNQCCCVRGQGSVGRDGSRNISKDYRGGCQSLIGDECHRRTG